MLQQFVDGVNVGVGQLKVLDLSLGGSRVGQATHSAELTPSEPALQHCPKRQEVRPLLLLSCPQASSPMPPEWLRLAARPPLPSATVYSHSSPWGKLPSTLATRAYIYILG